MRLRIGSIAVLLISIVVFASSAEACEKCVSAGYNNWVKCSSGHSSGYQSCYGGFGDPCTLGDACGSSGGGHEPENPVAAPIAPCLTCSADKPSQGFILRAAVNAAAGVVQGEVTQPETPAQLSQRE